MGYKLAGYDVIGCNEIDHRMMYTYCQNHNPRFPFLEPIQDFKNREDLPPELFNLDILDGSPPCSTFSMAGVNCGREKSWGKMKKFREGQAEQILDTLFFDFIDLAKKLQPKVIVAENVKGLLLGEAKKYVQRIYTEMTEAGYHCQHFVLDAQTMGVPQRRERVFFVALRDDLVDRMPCQNTLFDVTPVLKLTFNESPILFSEVMDGKGREIESAEMRKRWEARQPGDDDFGDVTTRLYGRRLTFNTQFAYADRVCNCLTGKEDSTVLFDYPRYLSQSEVCKIASFPTDYDFGGNKPHYVAGMSVPPVMMAQIATAIWGQWLSKI
ncbi:MAG: DNA (cytosine-5-)-methyltransferase [Ruminococcus sp.]|nr:DNA (cytosine-5-)-methyltransferase [Ruminococcus sp.]